VCDAPLSDPRPDCVNRETKVRGSLRNTDGRFLVHRITSLQRPIVTRTHRVIVSRIGRFMCYFYWCQNGEHTGRAFLAESMNFNVGFLLSLRRAWLVCQIHSSIRVPDTSTFGASVNNSARISGVIAR
jgi:hypothetical protein